MDHSAKVYSPIGSVRYIASDALKRVHKSASSAAKYCLLVFTIPPRKVLAANTIPFEPVSTLSPEQADSVDQEGGELDLANWVDRGMTIRGGDSVYQCLANLTAALDLVGQLNNAEYNGAAGALSLLPTAGALLGAPTREMWIVYKLVPIAGIFSMFLSLGGSITPSNVGDYDPSEPFSYSGFMPTTRVKANPKSTPAAPASQNEHESGSPPKTELQRQAKLFAAEVNDRASDDGGGNIFLGVAVAMALQFCLIVALLIPMWYAQKGAVVTWWCRVWGWMYFWYFLVSGVSIFDNIVAAPFTKSWKTRVSRMPSGLVFDGHTPR
ncbi:hypothetical protein QQX98_002335 [Neonectria punicea]|uniref:Autophagy-related protein n=1 Tax=Neonectria punicea TaxID=979145 RepID=A0ABR1HJY9_9HYPO